MAPSIWQILIIVLVVLLVFGAGRLPRIMEDLAKGIKSFKKGLTEEEKEEGQDKKPETLESTDAPSDNKSS